MVHTRRRKYDLVKPPPASVSSADESMSGSESGSSSGSSSSLSTSSTVLAHAPSTSIVPSLRLPTHVGSHVPGRLQVPSRTLPPRRKGRQPIVLSHALRNVRLTSARDMDLEAAQAVYVILCTSTHRLLPLEDMYLHYTLQNFSVHAREQNILLEIMRRYPYLQERDGHKTRGLSSELVRDMIRLIDAEFFEGSIIRTLIGRYRYYLHCRIVSSSELPACGVFHGKAPDYIITINEDYFTSLDSEDEFVCGAVCHTPLQTLLRTIEHELAHLIVTLNWQYCTDAHGPEFMAVVFGFFRHSVSKHNMPNRASSRLIEECNMLRLPYDSLRPALRACTIRSVDPRDDEPEESNVPIPHSQYIPPEERIWEVDEHLCPVLTSGKSSNTSKDEDTGGKDDEQEDDEEQSEDYDWGDAFEKRENTGDEHKSIFDVPDVSMYSEDYGDPAAADDMAMDWDYADHDSI